VKYAPAAPALIHVRNRFLAMIAAALAVGAFVLIYRGPGREIVRGNVGDGAATLLVYALLGLAWHARIRTRALTTFAFACAIELGQTVWHAKSLAGELALGSTFDPWDVLAYAIGVAVAVMWERRQAQRGSFAELLSGQYRGNRCGCAWDDANVDRTAVGYESVPGRAEASSRRRACSSRRWVTDVFISTAPACVAVAPPASSK